MIPMRWRRPLRGPRRCPGRSARARHRELYGALLRNDISKWGDKFLKALEPQDRKHQNPLRSFAS